MAECMSYPPDLKWFELHQDSLTTWSVNFRKLVVLGDVQVCSPWH
jgi:hypothetical protein